MNKDLKYYKDLKYRMIVEYFPEDQAYFVKFPELPGCIADGSIPEEAVNKALKVKDEWLAIALETGWTIPEPTAPFKTSGRITVRTSKTLHDRLNDQAQQEGISLNQLILTYLAQGMERSTVELRLEQPIRELTDKVNLLQRNILEHKPHAVFISGSFSGSSLRGKLIQRPRSKDFWCEDRELPSPSAEFALDDVQDLYNSYEASGGK
jgi:antitoxin HicB